MYLFPGKIIHHTVTAVRGGTAALVIGGRGSPTQPNESVFLLQLNISPSSKAMWSRVELHPESSQREPSWRHTASCMKINDGGYLPKCMCILCELRM